MKHILFIAPSCFPVTSAEAIVNLNLLRTLSDADYIIDVVSRSHPNQIYPDSSLEEYEITLNSINIIPTDTSRSIKNYWRHLLAYFKFESTYSGAHWAYIALPLIEKLLSQNEYDAVITKDLPSELIGIYIKNKHNIKWIATWNDPFPICKYPFPYGQGINANLPLLQRKLINNMSLADYHIFPSNRLQEYMLKYLPITKDRTIVIPHVVLQDTKNTIKGNGKLKIIHSGSLKAPRNPIIFLQAFSNFLKKYPKANIQLDFLGHTPNLIELVNTLNIHEKINILKPVSYNESLKILSTYNIALIIEAPCEEGIFLPTKVGDCMKCNVDIFAISPQNGVLNDLYKTKHIKYFAECKDVNSIFKQLEKIWFDFLNQKNCIMEIPESFSADRVLAQYQKIL